MVVLPLLCVAALTVGVYASPPELGWIQNYALLKRDTSFPSSIVPSCVPFIIGQNSGSGGTPFGNVCVTVDPASQNLTVTYPTNPGGYLYDKEHVWVGCNPPTGVGCSRKNPPLGCDNSDAPGQFPFHSGNGYCTNSPDKKDASCTFNIATILAACNKCDQTFYIIAHASVFKTNPDGSTSGATGVGQGTPYDTTPWWKQYWSATFICLCTSTITYPADTYFFTLESTTTVTSISTTSYITTSTTVLTITTTSSSIYETTEYSTTIYTSTSTTTSISLSTPITTSTSTCHITTTV